MNMFESFQMMMAYIYEAAARVFSPNQDDYPTVGVNPFEGDPYKGPNWAD